MSSLAEVAAFAALKEALETAKIQNSPLQVLQKSYLLNCFCGSHSYQLAGKVTSVQLSDTGGFELFVSSSYLGSDRIRSVTHSIANGWEIRTEQNEHFPIEFELV